MVLPISCNDHLPLHVDERLHVLEHLTERSTSHIHELHVAIADVGQCSKCGAAIGWQIHASKDHLSVAGPRHSAYKPSVTIKFVTVPGLQVRVETADCPDYYYGTSTVLFAPSMQTSCAP